MNRLLYEPLRKAAWQKGYELFPYTRRRCRGYTLRPATDAIFSRDPGPWGFFDLVQVDRWLRTAPEPIACRWSYDLWKAVCASRARAATKELARSTGSFFCPDEVGVCPVLAGENKGANT